MYLLHFKMKYLNFVAMVCIISINLFFNRNIKVQADSHNVTKNTTALNKSTVISEGGSFTVPKEKIAAQVNNNQDIKHEGREHTVEKPVSAKLNNSSVVSSTTTTTTSTTTTVAPIEHFPQKPAIPVIEKTEHNVIVGRKGVIDPDLNSSTTSRPKPKKPLITETDDNPIENPNTDTKGSANKSSPHKKGDEVPSIENIIEKGKRKNSADYVVPIVAVILSVPLVAIIISVLYKRGSEWWQHRHYRRMDFLIEGMYNN